MPSKPRIPRTKTTRAPAPEPSQPQTVLLAVTGLSPAVLTETVWALATQHRILPHRIVLLTTMEGKRHLEEKLFTPKKEGRNKSVWEALRTELGASADQLKIDGYRIMTGPADIHSPARELEDIRNENENNAAADFILNQVRTEVQSSSRLIASIAGGRKTMGTLLYAAMSLVARPQHWVTHVIVNAPFDRKLTPDFYFKTTPPTRHEERDRDGALLKTHSSDEARIELARIPFVPLSNRFKDLDEHEHPSTFLETVARISRGENFRDHYTAELRFTPKAKQVSVDGFVLEMESPAQVLLLQWLCTIQGEEWMRHESQPIDFQCAAEFCRIWHGCTFDKSYIPAHLKRFAESLAGSAPGSAASWPAAVEPKSFTRVLNILREKLGPQHPWLIKRRTLTLPPFKVLRE